MFPKLNADTAVSAKMFFVSEVVRIVRTVRTIDRFRYELDARVVGNGRQWMGALQGCSSSVGCRNRKGLGDPWRGQFPARGFRLGSWVGGVNGWVSWVMGGDIRVVRGGILRVNIELRFRTRLSRTLTMPWATC